MRKIKEENHFIYLTLALVGMLITGALSELFPQQWLIVIMELSSVLFFLIALLSLQYDATRFKQLLTFIGIILLVVIARNAAGIDELDYIYLFLLLVFFVMAAWQVGKQVLLTGSVNANKIIGSIALYMLLGMIWAILYTALLEVSPGALKGIDTLPWIENVSRTTYFSFVTLTTLGFGDISPATPMAEVLVYLEAITGMFYMAIVVASLISAVRQQKTGSTAREKSPDQS
jgi:voltage-gated potassium channel Kch